MKYWINILVILGVIFLIFNFIKNTKSDSKKKQELVSNKYFTIAKLDSIKDTYDSGKYTSLIYRFYYLYEYHNTLYHDSSTYRREEFYKFSTNKRNQIINKNFPIVISTKNPLNNQCLFLRTDYAQFNLAFPDSLKWTEKLFLL